jgi:phospholipid/cholesterol/gamma-HCH transport system permease protein
MWTRLRALFHATGAPVVGAVSYAVRLAAVIGEGLLDLVGRSFRPRPAVRQVLYRQIFFTGVKAVPFTMLLAMLVALVVAVQSPWSAAAGSEVLGRVLVVVLIRELGPVVAAIIVIARSGTAMAAELATMRVNGEIDTLTALGIDPFEYLIVPRLVGMSTSLVILTILFLCATLGVSAVLSPFLGGPAPADLLLQVSRALRGVDAAALLAKTLLPGLAIAAVACLEGLSAWRSTTDIPPAVTRTVVRAFSIVFVWNTTVSTLLYLA